MTPSGDRPVGPPRLITRLLEATLPDTPHAQATLGDLHEEFLTRVKASPLRARLWYLRDGLGIVLRYVAHRIGERHRPRRGSRKNGRTRRPVAPVRPRTWEGMVEGLVRNIRYAVRRLLKAPAFTLIAILSLGLGIGANTAIFSVVNAVILRAQPYEDPEQLVDVYTASDGFSHGTLSYPDYLDVLEGAADVFAEVGGSQLTLLQVDVDQGVEVLPAEAVTGNYFSLLGVQPALGRLLGDEDHVAPGAHPVVVLGHEYWRTRFGGDAAVIGSELRLAGRPYTIIGVAPEDYRGTIRGLQPSAFVPIMMYDELQGRASSTLESRGRQSFFVKARMAPGATLAQAEAVMDRISTRLRQDYPENWTRSKALVLVPTADVIMNPMLDRVIVPAAGMLMGVVGLVLLIACANLASFLLARAADRRKEIAVRLAMGAGRRTLIGQLLTETVILSAVGGLVGVVLATQSLAALTATDLPLPLPITLDLSLDGPVLAFSLLVTLGAGVLFGLAPAVQSTDPDLSSTLRDESAGGGRSKGARLRSLLVVGQVAVSVVLLVGAGLFLRSLDASRLIDPGFGDAPTGILEIKLSDTRYAQDEGRAYVAALVDRIARIRGVSAVGFVDNLHLNPLSTQSVRVNVPGIEPPPGDEFHRVDYAVIDDGFLEAAGIPLIAGRGFDTSDAHDGQPVVLVTEAFARRFFSDDEALGRTIVMNDEETTIVGITADVKVRSLGEDPRPLVYRSYRQTYSSFITLLARTDGEADRVAVEMLAAARALDPEMMVVANKTMERHLAVMLIGRELGALVVGGFAVLALVLASIGLYGVVSYAVSRRAREVGIRLSLGADQGSVVRMLTGSGLRLVAVGAAIGLLAAAALSHLLSRLLYGVPPLDPVTFVAVPVVLGLIAMAAAWIPARRVTRIDPVGALRAE